MMSVIFYLFFFSAISYIVTVDSVQCHVCGGQENMSKLMKKAFTELNYKPDQFYGNCKATSGPDVCSNGTFCIKRAKIHRIGFNSFNFKYTTYTKGCATLREDNGSTPSNACYDLNQNGKGTGYTTSRLDCYCNSDFCNSSVSLLSTSSLAVLLIWFYSNY